MLPFGGRGVHIEMNTRRVFLGLPMLAAAVPAAETALPPAFPSQDPDMVREVVGASHFNFARVKELVTARPALAKASWDWGFGDWETALGAASHMGHRDTALFLLDHGAPATIFSAAMLGQLHVVRGFLGASPGIQKIKGPHGITLMAHALAGKEAAADVVTFLESSGNADEQPTLAPLSADEQLLLSGIYSFGSGPADKLEVKVTRGNLTVARIKGAPRNLFHLGSYAFYPAGADAVRVRFTVTDGKAKLLTVHDPGLLVTAERQP